MLNADLAIGLDIVIAVSCFALTARDKAGPAFFTAMNAVPLAELDAVCGSGATLAVIEPHSELLVLTRHGAAMMDNNLVPEASAWDTSRRSARRNRFAALGIRISRRLKKYPV